MIEGGYSRLELGIGGFDVSRTAGFSDLLQFECCRGNDLCTQVGGRAFELVSVLGQAVHVVELERLFDPGHEGWNRVLKFDQHHLQKVHISHGAIEGFTDIDDRKIVAHDFTFLAIACSVD